MVAAVYVTLYSLISGQWSGTDYTYTAFNATGSLAAIQTPTPGSTLSGEYSHVHLELGRIRYRLLAGYRKRSGWQSISTNPEIWEPR
jgi:hypothetical protein